VETRGEHIPTRATGAAGRKTNHIEAVRAFIVRSRLVQWSTTRIHATYSMEEVVATSDDLEASF
jgi:hypothetical protein